MRKLLLTPLAVILLHFCGFSQILNDFEDIDLLTESHWDGFSSTLGVFENELNLDGMFLHNTYSRTDWGSGLSEFFSGFAYSKETDSLTPGYTNQYSCIAGSGAGSSAIYGLFYCSTPQRIDFETPQTAGNLAICNSTYTYLAMRDGDAFAKKFGGVDGTDADYFFVRISGWMGESKTDSVDVYLADFRFEDSNSDYLISEWTSVDLSGLGEIDALEFSLFSSDQGDWGMNTPAYFCIDDVFGNDLENLDFISGTYWNGSEAALGSYNNTFESGVISFPNTYTLSDWGYGMSGFFSGWASSNETDNETPGYGNQFSAIPGSGADGSENYALCYNDKGSDTLFLTEPFYPVSLDITNGTYPYFSMLNGDGFAKKFGGSTGDDPDYLKLTIIGLLDGQPTGTVEFYLADFRSDQSADDYIINTWKTVDLSTLQQANAITFSLSSSDTGDWGMNTPAYFFIDNLVVDQATGIGNQIISSEIKLYPNPVVDLLYIESQSLITRIEVYSLNGQCLMNESTAQGNRLSKDLSGLRPGHYLLRIHQNGQIQTKKIIKR